MIPENRKLIIEQLGKKYERLSQLSESDIPSKGWIYSIRTALNMSLAQLAKRLNKSVPTIKEIEQREETKSITLGKLQEVAEALNFRLIYALIPNEKSIDAIIEKRANEVARQIVIRTSHTMKLENQENQKERIEQAINEHADKINNELPRYLWD
ncbi:MAG: mobile mystery protein A [Bacteroidetes bacterium]|nr:mobile mystery protein A [Bacteroidota bacterium]MBU2507990.1 mobile mystery protein A [Bacteroidota bacterium]